MSNYKNNKDINLKKELQKENRLTTDAYIKDLSKTLSKQISEEIFREKYTPVREVLTLVGMGVFAAGMLVMPGLPKAVKPFVDIYNLDAPEPWRRFNIPYLKRTLKRLEKRKLVNISEEDGKQVVKITNEGSQKILKYSLDSLEIKPPKHWDGQWRLVVYDIPEGSRRFREQIPQYFKSWGFYPLQESVYLHAYPCEKEIEFLREFLRMGEYIRILRVSEIENDNLFREFFGI